MLHMHLRVDLDKMAERAIVVDHVECADVAGTLSFGENRLILALTDGGKEPSKMWRPVWNCSWAA